MQNFFSFFFNKEVSSVKFHNKPLSERALDSIHLVLKFNMTCPCTTELFCLPSHNKYLPLRVKVKGQRSLDPPGSK